MRIKRYEGQYVHEVIAQIRDELGSDAMVLHTRWRNPAGLQRLLGRPKVEVWAGVREAGDDPEVAQAELGAQANGHTNGQANGHQGVAFAEPGSHAARAEVLRQAIEARLTGPEPPATPDGAVGAHLDVLDEVVAEAGLDLDQETTLPTPTTDLDPQSDATVALLSEFNDALARMETKLDRLHRQTSPEPTGSPRLSALLAGGVEPTVAEEIAAAAGERSVAEVLLDTFQCTGEVDLSDGPKVVALVGPSGVGKTTTAAKLAGHYHLHHGAEVMLCSTDTQRVGTFEQLRALGELMQFATTSVHTPGEASRRVEMGRRTHDLILVDTAAAAPGCPDDWERLVDTLIAAEPDEILLVLSASYRPSDAARVVDRFRDSLPVRGAVITKLDESRDAGLLVNLAWRHLLPLSYLAAGPRIPGDLEVARTSKLVERVWSARLAPSNEE